MVIVNRELCDGCGACAKGCLSGAITMDASGKAKFDPAAFCIECGHCVSACKPRAVSHADAQLARAERELQGSKEYDIGPFLTETRSKRNYEDRPVERTLIEEGLDVAQHAPSSANGHHVNWVVLEGKEKVAHFFEMCRKEYMRLGIFPEIENGCSRGKNMVTFNAPVMVFVYAGEKAFIPHADCVIAMMYADLFWRNRGMGTCWSAFALEAPNHSERIREFLHIPEGRTVYGAVSLGYPDEPAYLTVPGRRPPNVAWI